MTRSAVGAEAGAAKEISQYASATIMARLLGMENILDIESSMLAVVCDSRYDGPLGIYAVILIAAYK